MKSSHSKGKAKEREFLKWIDCEGFVFPMNKWGDNDALKQLDPKDGKWNGCTDGFYLGYGGCVSFFQVCHRTTKERHRRAIEAFVDEHPARNYTICLYSWDKASERKGMPFRLIRAW